MSTLHRFSLLLLAAALPAQGTFDLDKTSNGALGRQQTFAFAGAPAGSTMLYMLSTNAGPTPLNLVDPGETRSLAVGLELSSFWTSAMTGPGSGALGFPIPNDPALARALVHFQGITYPGSGQIFGALSNPVVQQLGIVDTATTLPATLGVARALSSTFRSGQDVVVAGGGQGNLLSATGLSSTEVFDFRTLTVQAGATMNGARALAVAVTLGDGRVLLAGGVDGLGTVVSTAEIYDPATGLYTTTGNMSRPRAAHDGVLLADGRVLVVGGTTTFADTLQALANAQNTAEIYDPATGSWSSARAMPDRLLAPDVTRLANGRVLLSGGFQVTVIFGFPVPIGSVVSCRIYNPASDSWANAAAMLGSRGAHGTNTILLGNGDVLVTGGASSGPDLTQATALSAAEIYNPAANGWTALPAMAARRTFHTVTVLPSGRVLVVGGADGTLTLPVSVGSVQEFDPAAGTWRNLPPLVTTRAGHSAILVDDGTVLVLGGQGGVAATTLASIETIRP